jgi:DNA-binding NarL/FixJ family response regulator
VSPRATRIRVLIADDQTLFRAGLVRILTADPRFEVVGQAVDGLAAVEQALKLRPDVVLMDLQMPKLDGVEATRRISREAPEVHILILSAFAVGSTLRDALSGGAIGYVHKDATPQDMTARILAIRSNGHAPAQPTEDLLSDREVNVLRLVARGLSNKEIAGRLSISDKTVRNHLSRIFRKLDAANRTEAVMSAMRGGLLSV